MIKIIKGNRRFGGVSKPALVITVPINDVPKLSHSGKTLLVASTYGIRYTGIEVQKRPLYLTLNACLFVAGERNKPTGLRRSKLRGCIETQAP